MKDTLMHSDCSLFIPIQDKKQRFDDIKWSQDGIGKFHYPDSDYLLQVMMKPSWFLQLATPLPTPRDSLIWLQSQYDIGQAFHPPSLDILIVKSNCVPQVVKHDGRHRTTMAMSLHGDEEIPVLFHIKTFEELSFEMVLKSLLKIKAQRSHNIISGDCFKDVTLL